MPRVQDPVCGMMIDRDNASSQSTFDGETYYFCSPACKEQFDENPEKYVGEAHATFSSAMGIPAPKYGFAGSGGAEYEPGPAGRERDDS